MTGLSGQSDAVIQMRHTRRSSPAILALIATWAPWGTGPLAQTTAPLGPSAPTSAPAMPRDRLRPVDVRVNGAPGGVWVLIERQGVWFAPKAALDQWRVTADSGAASVVHQGTPYLALSAVGGYSAQLDEGTQTLTLTFAASAFSATRSTGDAYARTPHSPVLPSVFFNYDLSYSANQRSGAPSIAQLSAVLDAGLSLPIGVLTSAHVGRNLATSGPSGTAREWVRLETTFSHDLPEHDLTWRLGDHITRPGLMGNSVYFGGFQIGSNHALSPGRLLQPRPSVSGVAAAPSTVELYINNALRQAGQVPAGPFTIENINSVSGSANARVVVRDVLGRETVFEQNVFSSTQLLDEGLADWSSELGALRENYSVRSNDYGDAFLAATYRRGVSKDMTWEGRVELSREVKTLAWAGVAALPGAWLGKWGWTGSMSEWGAAPLAPPNAPANRRRGSQWLAGLEYASTRWNANVQLQAYSRHFRQLGDDGATPGQRQQFFAQVLRYLDDGETTLGFALASQSRWDSPRLTSFNASFGLRVGARGRLQWTASRVIGRAKSSALGFSFILPLGDDVTVLTGANAQKAGSEAYVSANHHPHNDGVWGWRVHAGGREQVGAYAEAGAYYPGQHGRVSADIAARERSTSVRLGATGALVASGEGLFASQPIRGSFAVVSAPGLPGIPIKVGGQVRGQTDTDGKALVTRLGQYQLNDLQLDVNAIPVSAEIDSVETRVVPSYKSGVLARFEVKPGRSAVLAIRLANGADAPLGATLRVDGRQEEFFVGNKGLGYVSGLSETSKNRVVLSWKGQSCTLEFLLPTPPPDHAIKTGPLVCEGVRP